ncbi:DUF2911 domain-containing protein [Reichenbachiella ulvae]|uniref:DUF2911 domain-containing protein n=1 Tax=Reichenbachiella ulvae TaxID=2980104 RepID=A0ABT3CZM1_9BACT|nr:DUF2911 domain-containing protein [Reichenbachiella ulvae]MCV9388969.1 DUF2911 domain-containing protein [Reichenbachiella ulvae]
MLKKSIFLSTLVLSVLFLSQLSYAQEAPKASPFKSTSAEVNGKTVTIEYSAPSKKDRKIWGGLVPYGKVWRTGANEATTLEVSADVKVAGKDLKKGKYAIFTIPNQDKWTVIINKNPNQWGAYSYKEAENLFSFEVKPKKSSLQEMFSITVSPEGLVTMAWDELKVEFTIQ